MDQNRQRWDQAARDAVRWPYPAWSYPARLLWRIVWMTLWKLCWHRFRPLRPLILRLFGTRTKLDLACHGSAWIEMPWDLKLGSKVLIGPRATLYNLGGIEIGDHVVISQDAYLCGGTHDYTDPAFPLVRRKIVVGSYAWIAAGAFIGPGVTIGEGAVVGARAVVTRDVEPWTIVAGNPATVVRRREMKYQPQPSASGQPGSTGTAG